MPDCSKSSQCLGLPRSIFTDAHSGKKSGARISSSRSGHAGGKVLSDTSVSRAGSLIAFGHIVVSASLQTGPQAGAVEQQGFDLVTLMIDDSEPAISALLGLVLPFEQVHGQDLEPAPQLP